MKPDLILSLHHASAALQQAHQAALSADRRDLADAIRDEATRVLKLIGLVATNRTVEVQS